MKSKPPIHYGKDNNMYRHGFSRTKLEKAYIHMIDRCYNPKSTMYYNYGARGITVCDEWRNDNKEFFNWAITHGYIEGLTLDRIDNDKGYSPENCRWVTMKEQQNNRRDNVWVEIDGVRHTVSQWAEIYNIPPNIIYARINRCGWDKVMAVTVPVMSRGGDRRATVQLHRHQS